MIMQIIIGLSLVLILILSIAFAVPVHGLEEEWKIAYIVGEYRYSDPPKTDEVFKVHYRVINGTLGSFTTKPLVAKVSSEGSGVLEVMFPRDYPYTNHQSGIDNFLINSRTDPSRVIKDTRAVTDCFFVFSIPFVGRDEIEIDWVYLLWQEPWHGDDILEDCISQTIAQATPEMLEECEELGIAKEDCNEAEILKKRSDGQLPSSDEERKRIEDQQNQINNSMYMVGIGAAIAGAVAFVMLWRRK